MSDAIAAISPVVAVPPVQPAAAVAPAATNGTKNVTGAQPATSSANTNAQIIANANALNSFEQLTALENEILQEDSQNTATTATSNTDDVLLDGALLTNLNPQAIAALNGLLPTTTTAASGALTPLQIEEISTLALDAQILNTITDTETVPANGSLIEGASTVSLSPAAASIINAEIAANVAAGSAFTTTQLQQIANAITPYINQPITTQTLTQIQNTLTAEGFNPLEISLQSLLLAMNYVGEVLPVQQADAEELATNEMITTELEEM